MKKVLALALAVTMVLSLASVVLAAKTNYVYAIDSVVDAYWKVKSKEVYIDTVTTSGDTVTIFGNDYGSANKTASFGNTIYYPLVGVTWDKDNGYALVAEDYLATSYDAVKSVKISQDWDIGSEWVSKVEFVKKRFGSGGDYSYFLAVTFKAAATRSESADVVGELTLKKTSGDNKINRDGNRAPAKEGELEPFAVNIELHYNPGDTSLEVTDSSLTFNFDNLGEDEETEFSFTKWEGAYFTVNTYGQGKIVLKATTDYNADVGAQYPEGNLDFYNGNGATFNKTGEMFLPADSGSYIYELKNGVLVEIPSAVYDDYEEGFFFRTRSLGVYVVSDVELDVSAAPVVTPGGSGGITVVDPGIAPTVPVNPGTGAAA